jgi:hypothetical protein
MLRILRQDGSPEEEIGGLASGTLALIEGIHAIGPAGTLGAIAERFPDWSEESLARIVAFLVRKGLLIELCVEPFEDAALERI